jgi:hypothetical protein
MGLRRAGCLAKKPSIGAPKSDRKAGRFAAGRFAAGCFDFAAGCFDFAAGLRAAPARFAGFDFRAVFTRA